MGHSNTLLAITLIALVIAIHPSYNPSYLHSENHATPIYNSLKDYHSLDGFDRRKASFGWSSTTSDNHKQSALQSHSPSTGNNPFFVELVTRDGCGFSAGMRSFLNDNHIPFKDYNQSHLSTDMRAKFGYPDHTFPLVLVNGEYVGGYSDALKDERFLSRIDNK